ncbi:hypothetical protein MTR67_039615 [Solanum verrucosum]|uniref:Uncharacterized protein n=1 Tax=Solanum verrucosum TaxID=315347 RepID=A0AAF0UI97_SOLVR|nr:hypothetical protein MTR67_039615 [Solanum verrucosum]
MQTRGRNRLDFQLQNDEGLRQYVEQLMDEQNIDQAQPYIEQLINRNERRGYVRGLGLGPTPSALWGSRSFLENIDEKDSSNEIVQRLHYYPSHLKFTENTGDPKNTGLRKTTAHAEFATSGPGHTGAESDVLVYLVFLTCQSMFLV